MEILETSVFIENSEGKIDEHFGVFDLARLDFAIQFLSKYESAKPKIDTILSGGKLILPEEESKKRVQGFSKKSEHIVAECEQLEEELVKAKNELAKLPGQSSLLEKLGDFNIPLTKDYSTEQTKTLIGSILTASESKFLEKLSRQSNLLDLQILSRSNRKTFIRITGINSLSKPISEQLNNFQFEELDYASDLSPFFGKTPAEIHLEIEKNNVQLQARIESINRKASDFVKYLEDLRILFDYNQWWKRKSDLQHKILRTSHLFAFEGWTAEREVWNLEKWLKNTFVGEVILEKIEKAKDEAPPVLLKNEKGVSSFEPIVDMFGVPSAKEFDPTAFMMPFFTVFFGLCLSDVGYGSILTLIAAWLLIFGKFSKEAKNSILLLLICGTSAIIGGVILGGYFGMTPAQAPGFLVSEGGKFYGQLLDPMAGMGPIIFLGIALGLGVLQLLFGICLDFVKKVQNKEYVNAFCDSAAWFFFLLMLILFGVADFVGLPKDLFANLSLAGAGILVLTQGRDQKNWLLKPIFGILGLYNVTSYLSDLLSYSRIMALGLATGVVGFAMNMTAAILGEMVSVPVLGTIIAVAVILFGHTLNFALSLLGAFIHSGRLQFIEFFGKFYEGGGRKFLPFKRENKYISFR